MGGSGSTEGVTGVDEVEGDAAIDSVQSAYEVFVAVDGERLRRVACARYGIEVGNEVTADALAWAWEHWERVETMANPVGYLFRVAQSAARRHHRWRRPVRLPAEPRDELRSSEPGLERALATLAHRQRTAVLLVHGLGWSYQEAADAMGVSLAAVRNHVHRGLKQLRRVLGVQP